MFLREQPSNSDVQAAIAFVQRRQGKWREAADNFRRAVKIDPRSQGLAQALAVTLQSMREYRELIRGLDKSLSLSPDAAVLLFFKANAVLLQTDDTIRTREILDQAIRYGEPDMVAFWMEGFDILFRDYESAVSRRKGPGSFMLADTAEFYLSKADAYRFLGRNSLSLIYYDSARIVAERKLNTDPETASYHLVLGTALAGLGRFSDGIREGKRAAELVPISQDAMYGTGIVEQLAYIYVLAGEFDLAIDQLDTLMSIPSGLGIYVLHHHPQYDPIRDHPRFQALLEKYGDK